MSRKQYRNPVCVFNNKLVIMKLFVVVPAYFYYRNTSLSALHAKDIVR